MPAPEFFAHSPAPGSARWHRLDEHLERVADLAAERAEKFGAGEAGRLAGHLHDAGKATREFQRRLNGARGRVDHSSAGAVLASELYAPDGSRLDATAPGLELAWVIAAHHAGLDTPAGLEERLVRKAKDPLVSEGIRAIMDLLPAVAERLELGSPPDLPELPGPRARALFVRMLLSALVDADHLDTESHRNPAAAGVRTVAAGRQASLQRLHERLEANQLEKQASAPPTAVNIVRREVYESCLERALEPPGFFRLAVPTGGGKTRSSLAFALRHAVRHRLDRVIYALPFLSIIDQTAREFRGILGDENVLEHHSGFNPESDEAETESAAKLATENWDAPIIVTTTIQLLESLFANRPSRIRKLHNLCRSVIVLDEVQALPTALLEPTLDALRELVRAYNVTVVLCTATQPALDAHVGFPTPENVRDIVPDPARHYRTLDRVLYEPLPDAPWDWQRVAQEMTGAPSALCVLNTKKQARALIETLDRTTESSGDTRLYHLSTSMCGAHRKAVLDSIRRRLRKGRPCRVVSTQLVEAGVDLDFPLVLRAMGPLDSIVQAAGRCNRDGRLGLRGGRMIVFRPADAGAPSGSYRTAMDVARSFLERGADLNDPATFVQYFKLLYRSVGTDAYGVQSVHAKLDFPEVARRYRLIDDDTVPVLVRNYDARSVSAALEHLDVEPLRQSLRRLQPFLVNVYRAQLAALQSDPRGLVRPAAEFERRGIELLEWSGVYDARLGIIEESDANAFVL